MRISDWSSDVCSSDLLSVESNTSRSDARGSVMVAGISNCRTHEVPNPCRCRHCERAPESHARGRPPDGSTAGHRPDCRSEEHTSELQSLMRITYAVFCLKKKKQKKNRQRQ